MTYVAEHAESTNSYPLGVARLGQSPVLCQARRVTVGAVFGAEDGLLVIIDGVESEVDHASLTGLRSVEVRQRKFAIAPEAPAVVILTGQASLAGTDAWQWAEDFMSREFSDGVALGSPGQIARQVVTGLETVIAKDTVNRKRQGRQSGSGVEGLLAAAIDPASPGCVPGEVWSFAIDEELTTTGPNKVLGFTDPGSPWPLVIVPDRPAFIPLASMGERLPADAILERFQHQVETFRTTELKVVRERVIEEMSALAGAERDALSRHGVGGLWAVIEIRSSDRPRVTYHDWGPGLPALKL